MPGGAFNVSQLIRELGLQAVTGDEMRVQETIQPTMRVADLSDVTPPHVAPTAIFGLETIPVAVWFFVRGWSCCGASACAATNGP